MNVKQERHDEAEIQELAAKFVEANKAKMALPQRPLQQAGQSMNILSFLTTDKNKAKTNSVPVQSTSDSETRNIDEESIKGRFGWTLMGKMHIPYILRSGESYCAVRMVEMKVLNKLLNYLHQDLYNCTNIRSYYITEAEARLLNEINFKHCDYQFGREQFTSRDLIVRLTDANEFYQFLGHCYAKLVNTTDADNLDRCGFIRINRESVVPYTVYNEQKYVPLFYFEGETDNLKQRADKLEGWDLSYLKFCCKVQGIRNELFAHDSCSVISLNDIKNYFPPGTLFEDYWPKKNLDSQLLINNRNPNQQQIVQWTRQPTAPPITAHPPPSPKPATQAKAANNSHMHNVHVYSNYGIAGGQPPYHAAQPRTASSAVRATYPSAASRHMRPYFSNIGQAPPPLVRANSSTLAQYNAQTKSAGNYMIIEPNMNQNNYHQASQSSYPPPLLHMNGGISRYEGPQTTRYGADNIDLAAQTRELQNNYGVNSTSAQLVNQQPAHQSTRTQSASVSEERSSMTNGRSVLNNVNRNKLSTLPDAPPTSGNNIPYKIQKALVEGKMIPCINMKPNVWTEMLVSLPDLVTNFFNNVPVQSCQQVMQVLGIEVFKANPSQVRLLLENGRCQNANETIPLVQVRNVIDYMPQLKYMLSGMTGMLTSDVAAKRQRNS
ncbi:uncharacterized protein LOC108916953 isoform X2 [Anoplophora glabripennis]|uniref:uncharacterized protein LOC108916953 isoform X2 n=1 Tax=Anoplophora glabripennis TaxID=217634 RepID=UPI000C793843|nr:uncharacterized protein LOC108916953 isoform X2 [Anoplophora glabripennis]